MYFQKTHQSGLSLIELLVALAVSLILVVVVASSYLGSRSANKTTDEQTQLYEEGRYALELLGKNIRSAGFIQAVAFSGKTIRFNDPDETRAVFPIKGIPIASRTHALRGCAGGVDASYACLTTPATGVANALTVTYFTDDPNSTQNTNGVKNSDLGVGLDCAGQAAPVFNPPGGGNLYLVQNTFFLTTRSYIIDGQTKILKELSCLGNGNPLPVPQPLFKGVQDMQLLFGIPLNNAVNAVDRYYKAEEVEANDSWHFVINVRVCLVMEAVRGGAVSGVSTYVDCNGATQSAPSGYLRRAFTSTFNLRNRVPLSQEQ
ncbi:MAG: PilW family protein [Gammaproteobacteria bacterium]|nr:PilW family protein [Gammaproteobacteria bacterium]